MNDKTEEALDLGVWMGRRQSLAMVAGGCSAADAKCIYTIRHEKKYKTLGMNWEQFCKERLGISRSWADTIIRQWEELGGAYFALAQLTGIKPDEYRAIRDSISGQRLLHAGEEIPIEAEQGPKLVKAIAEMRGTTSEPTPVEIPGVERSIAKAERSLRAAITEFERIDTSELDPGTRTRLLNMLNLGTAELKVIELLAR